jgi:hypothetical protein
VKVLVEDVGLRVEGDHGKTDLGLRLQGLGFRETDLSLGFKV